MKEELTLDRFLSTQNTIIDPLGFSGNLILGAILATILGFLYLRYGSALSNRAKFAALLPLITITTVLVIAIVKSSLALSLGLVGALSIVRFRTPIKEPEELAYLFLSIAIGLGLGAAQTAITLLATVLIMLFIVVRAKFHRTRHSQNLFLTAVLGTDDEDAVKKISDLLSEYCQSLNIHRLDRSENILEVTFNVGLKEFAALDEVQKALVRFDPSIKVTFIDAQGTLL